MACSDYAALEDADSKRRDVASWLTGYLTAHNRLVSETYDFSAWQSPATASALLAQYCAANPDDIVEAAAQALINYLSESRLTSFSETVSQGSGSKITILYTEVIQRSIRRLRSLGYTVEASQEGLSLAIRKYQLDVDLPLTGLLDQPTLGRLLE